MSGMLPYEFGCEYEDALRPDCHIYIPIYGPRITPTTDGEGLLMTTKNYIYHFECNEHACSWSIGSYRGNQHLTVHRLWHIFLTVPATVVEDC